MLIPTVRKMAIVINASIAVLGNLVARASLTSIPVRNEKPKHGAEHVLGAPDT